MSARECRLTEAAPEIPAKASGNMITVPTDSGREARRRRDRIKLLLTSMTEQTNKVVAILEEAQTNEDHTALGYASWTAYVAGEYAGLLEDLNRAQRREVVGSLTAIGMPTRAIAAVVGVDHSTVVRDQNQVVQHAPPAVFEGDDLTVMADATDADFDAAITEAKAEGDVSRENVEKKISAAKKVTGLDGKSYTVPRKPVIEPGKPRRSSLPDQYRTAIWDLDKVVRRLEKYHADDRFASHREAFGNHHRLLIELAEKVGLFAIQVSNDHADRVFVEMSAEGKIGGAR